ncbi:unnamed protein product, partial [Symbiodinium natans]
VEVDSLMSLLRNLPGLGSLKPSSLLRCLPEISVHFVPPGQPLLPSPFWFFILDGSFDIIRFVPAEPAMDIKGADDALGMPDCLRAPPAMQRLGQRPSQTSFWGLTAPGPDRDGWLLAAGKGVTVARLPAECLKQLSRGPT